MEQVLDRFEEVQTDDAFALQNSQILRVRLDDETLKAKSGSMVAFQGDLKFEAASEGGFGRMLKQAFSSEDVDLMNVTGTGEVFLTANGQELHVIDLEGDELTCNGDALISFTDDVDWDIKKVKGFGGRLAGGWSNVTLSGNGKVCLASDGNPVRLRTAEAPTFVDPEAAVAWSSNLEANVSRDFGGLKSVMRGGTGEGKRIEFAGDGWVLVQPSEAALADRVTTLETKVSSLESRPS